jgi:hypothetical protein
MRRYEETLHFVAADKFLQEKVAAPLRRLPLTTTPTTLRTRALQAGEECHQKAIIHYVFICVGFF